MFISGFCWFRQKLYRPLFVRGAAGIPRPPNKEGSISFWEHHEENHEFGIGLMVWRGFYDSRVDTQFLET